MRVKLRRIWFAPDISGATETAYVAKNGRPVLRGHRLRKGIHEVPDEWRDKLPSDARVLEDEDLGELEDVVYPNAGNAPKGETKADGEHASLASAAANHVLALQVEEEERRQEKLKVTRVANLAKARETKRQNKENKANA